MTAAWTRNEGRPAPHQRAENQLTNSKAQLLSKRKKSRKRVDKRADARRQGAASAAEEARLKAQKAPTVDQRKAPLQDYYTRWFALVDGVLEGDLERDLEFLEQDLFFFRSGYIKARILTRLKGTPLSPEQRARVRQLILRRVAKGDCREFRRYCRLARTVEAESFSRDLRVLQAGPDRGIARRARWVLNALQT